MTQEKSGHSSSIHDTLDSAVNTPENRELARIGREVMGSSPPASEKMSRAEIRAASDDLVSSTKAIVDSILVVIGSVDKQTAIQEQHHQSERLMMNMLEGELRSTRRDNAVTRRLVMLVIFTTSVCITAQLVLMIKIFDQYKLQSAFISDTSERFDKAYAIMLSNAEHQNTLNRIIEEKPTVVVRQTDKAGSAELEIKQPVSVVSGKTDYDVVKIPIALKRGEVRSSIESVKPPKKTPLANSIDGVLKPQSEDAPTP